MFVSRGLVSAIQTGSKKTTPFLFDRTRDPQTTMIRNAEVRVIPEPLAEEVGECLRVLARSAYLNDAVPWALKHFTQYPKISGSSFCLLWGLGRERGRKVILSDRSFSWKTLWSQTLPTADIDSFIKGLRSEIEGHQEGNIDNDLAYVADIVKRIESGLLTDGGADLRGQASAALADAAKEYPSVGRLSPSAEGPPDVQDVLDEISAALPDTSSDDEIPF